MSENASTPTIPDTPAYPTIPDIPSGLEVQQLLETHVLPWTISIVMAILIFLIGKFVVKMIVKFVKKLMLKAKVDEILINFVGSIIGAVLLLFVIIAALDQLGVNTTSMIALIGAAGLAVGLALQGTLQNFASGVMLIMFRPFNAGDYVEVASTSGTVEEVGIFTTTLLSVDNREIIIPNGEIFGGVIVNYSKRATRRVDMVFGIGYDDDLLKAKEIITRILGEDKRILADPAPVIVVGELADSSVNFNVRPWCKTADYWGVYGDMHERIKLAFDAEGISIPYPQMDVHQYVPPVKAVA